MTNSSAVILASHLSLEASKYSLTLYTAKSNTKDTLDAYDANFMYTLRKISTITWMLCRWYPFIKHFITFPHINIIKDFLYDYCTICSYLDKNKLY